MNIEELLNGVGDYFKQKIISGDFELKHLDSYTATVLIDQKYKLDLWIANDPKENFEFYDRGNFFKNEALLDFLFKSKEERIQAWEKIKPFIDSYRRDVVAKEKLKEIDRLKKDLKSLLEK